MISSRMLEEKDYELLSSSLYKDEFHKDTDLSFFLEDQTITNVFEDEEGPVLFVRAKALESVISLDIQFINNLDARRNMRTMTAGFPVLAERAKENGFYAFMFASTVSLLRKFCCRRLGFSEYDDQLLVKVL